MKKDTYIRGYSKIIHPIPEKDSWPNFDGDEILPLLVKRPPERPRLTRRREADKTPPERGRYMM